MPPLIYMAEMKPHQEKSWKEHPIYGYYLTIPPCIRWAPWSDCPPGRWGRDQCPQKPGVPPPCQGLLNRMNMPLSIPVDIDLAKERTVYIPEIGRAHV